MNLPQLQQQIVSEAVKAFREKHVRKSTQGYDDTEFIITSVDSVVSFLTDQLNQAMRKVAEETVNAIDPDPDGEAKFMMERATRWLNQDSEGEDMVTIETKVPIYDGKDEDCPYCFTNPITPHAHRQDFDKPFHVWRGV